MSTTPRIGMRRARLVGRHMPGNTTPDEAAAWVAALRVVLNLDEFITRE